jgi:hypothetical protein
MFSGGYTAYESSVLYRQFKASVQHPKIEVLLAVWRVLFYMI